MPTSTRRVLCCSRSHLLGNAVERWLLDGTLAAERGMLRTFGEDYRRHQREVPMLLPRPRRPPLPTP